MPTETFSKLWLKVVLEGFCKKDLMSTIKNHSREQSVIYKKFENSFLANDNLLSWSSSFQTTPIFSQTRIGTQLNMDEITGKKKTQKPKKNQQKTKTKQIIKNKNK